MPSRKLRSKKSLRRKKKSNLIQWFFLILVVLTLPFIVYQLRNNHLLRGNAQSATKPNIILIYTDDQRWDTLKYMPQVNAKLVKTGLNFKNSFVTDPLCCPSRASLLSGQHVFKHGVKTIRLPDGGAAKFDTRATLATWLKTAGYKTGYMGKYLNYYGVDTDASVPPGWDQWHVFIDPLKYYNYKLSENGTVKTYGSAPEDYATDVLATKALSFIDSSASPFFLIFAPFAPHTPAAAAPRHEGTCDTLTVQNRKNYNEDDLSDKPQWVQGLNKVTTSGTNNRKRTQICSLKAVDEAVGQIVKKLEDTGKLDNTVIIYTSDNGYMWGEHRYFTKHVGYEESIRVPLVIWSKHISKPRAPTALVLNLDVTATIVELAGATATHALDGKSLVPLFSAEASNFRNDFLIENYAFGGEPENFGVRTKRYKYLEYSTGELELYDLNNDPYELNNLAHPNTRTSFESVIKTMSRRLDVLRPSSETTAPSSINETDAGESLTETH